MSGPRVGLALSYDGTRAPAILRRVYAAELGRRLEELDLRVLTPLGLADPHDGGIPAQALRDADPARNAEELDLLIIAGRLTGAEGMALIAAGGEMAAAGGEVAYEPLIVEAGDPLPPVAGIGCELADEERLAAMGALEAVSLPGYARLLSRHVEPASLRRSQRLCELAGWLEPAVEQLVLADDDPALAPQVEEVLATSPRLGVAVLGSTPDDVPTLPKVWPSRARKLPWYAGVDEYLAVAGLAVHAVGEGAGRALASGAGEVRSRALGGVGEPVEDARLTILDERLDALAARARARWLARGGRLSGSSALERERRHMATERAARDRRTGLALTRSEVEIRELELRVAQLEGLAALAHGLQAELESVTTSRTWRYTSAARNLYRQARKRTGLS